MMQRVIAGALYAADSDPVLDLQVKETIAVSCELLGIVIILMPVLTEASGTDRRRL